MLSKELSSTIFKVFGMTRSGIEPRSSGTLARTLPTVPMSSLYPGTVGRVRANVPEDLGSIPDRLVPKTLKMVLDTSLLNTQKYKVRF